VSAGVRVVFFGNSQSIFSNRFFAPLLEAPCEVVGVVDLPPAKRQSTNPRTGTGRPSFVDLVRKRGTPIFEPSNPNTPEFVETLAAINPELFLAAGYMFLLKPPLLSIPRSLAVNLHASLLPAYRGKHPVFWALRNGERQAGLTAHVMDPHFDTGDILYQVRVRTRKRDTVSTLYDRIIEKSVALVPRLITDVAQGTLRRIPQPRSSGSYFSSVSDEHFQLDWTLPAETLRRWIQTSPGECWRTVKGRRVSFLDAQAARFTPGSAPAVPGQLIQIGRSCATLATGEGALVLHWVQPAGESKRSLARLCAESVLKAGDMLGMKEENAAHLVP
jgi:methionyl-tRNA formyltransferase